MDSPRSIFCAVMVLIPMRVRKVQGVRIFRAIRMGDRFRTILFCSMTTAVRFFFLGIFFFHTKLRNIIHTTNKNYIYNNLIYNTNNPIYHFSNHIYNTNNPIYLFNNRIYNSNNNIYLSNNNNYISISIQIFQQVIPM